MLRNNKFNASKKIVIFLVTILISITLFVILVYQGFPRDFSNIFNNNNVFMLLISILTFFLCTRLKGVKPYISLLIILILFAIPISYYWLNAITTQKIIGGLIPHRDSMYYYLSARNILNGKLFDSMTNGRPLFPAFLAFIEVLTGENIQITIIILAILCSFSFYFVFNEMQIEFGSIPAAIFMGGMYVFYSRWITQLMSEQMGILLALLGLALIMNGMRNQKKSTMFLGILVSTLALNARAGAMFVLPTIAVFIGFAFKKKGFSFLDFGWAAATILLGFLINSLAFHLLTEPGVMPYSTFAYSFYGLTKGGAGWTMFQKDYPGLTDSKEVLYLALMNIKRYPLGLVLGAFKAYRDFFMPGINNAFVFITGYGSTLGVYTIWAITWFFTGYELVRAYRNIKNPFNKFELLVFAGILLSIPFARPTGSGSMRTYSATIPFLMLLPVAGLSHLLNKIDLIKKISNSDVHISYPSLMVAFSMILIFIIFFTPIFIKLFIKPVPLPTGVCSQTQTPAVFHLNKGSFITIIPDGSATCSGTPDICYSKFLSNASGFIELYNSILDVIKTPKEAVIFAAVNDLNNGKYLHILINQKEYLNKISPSQTIMACLTVINRPEFLYSATNINIQK